MILPAPLAKGTRILISYFANDLWGMVQDAVPVAIDTGNGIIEGQSVFVLLDECEVTQNMNSRLLYLMVDSNGDGIYTPYIFIKSLATMPEVSKFDAAREIAHYQGRAQLFEPLVRFVRDIDLNILTQQDAMSMLRSIRERAMSVLPRPRVEVPEPDLSDS